MKRMKVIQANILALFTVAITACTATLSPVDDVYMCVGQPQTFLCSVSNQRPAARLEWSVVFKDSRSVSNVEQTYTLPASVEDQHPIRDDRDGVSFVFNLTSNSSSLESTMTVMVADDNGTTLINNATVYCGQESDQRTVIHVSKVPLSSEMHLNNELMLPRLTLTISEPVTRIFWNPIENADQYIVHIFPSVDNDTTFITTNTSIYLPLFNQDYNISVVASNCAGNSTPVSEVIHVNHDNLLCNTSVNGLNIVTDSNGSEVEVDSHVTFYCHDGIKRRDDQNMTAICMRNGSWIPQLHSLKCPRNKIKQSYENAPFETWPIITATIIIVVVLLIVLISIVLVFMVKAYKKHHSQLALVEVEQTNHYSDWPVSNDNKEDEPAQGIYSLLQPHENTTRVESTAQTPERPGLVYAEVGSMFPLSANNNISLQLAMEDDQVQYADVRHQDSDTNKNSDDLVESSEEVPPPLPPKLVDFDAEMASDSPLNPAQDHESNEGHPSLLQFQQRKTPEPN